MKASDVERWAALVIGELERGRRREDDRVELKRRPKPTALENARRIAGHANQVREDRLLWLFGIDEDGARHGVPDELADPNSWWQPIESCFDEVAPSPVFVAIDGLLAVGFDAVRLPFVVRHPGDLLTREIPWREGTRIRSASRFDVMKLLVPISSLPRVTILDGFVNVIRKQPTGDSGDRLPSFEWTMQVWLYAETIESFVAPDHLLTVSMSMIGSDEDPVSFDVTATGSVSSHGAGVHLASRGVRQLVVDGPSPFIINGSTETPLDGPAVAPGARGRIEFRIGVGADREVVVVGRCVPTDPRPANYMQGSTELVPTAGWTIEADTVDR